MLVVNNILYGLAYILEIVLDTYFWIVLISCVLSWVNASPYNPIVRVVRTLTEPVFQMVRRKLPFVYAAGIDFSPVVVVLLVQFVNIALVETLRDFAMTM
ncbi:MAG: YggT family protein [Desulfovibrionaceae bacterium]|nr:YggT family protein [Desulfovibrionaceae bacterium]